MFSEPQKNSIANLIKAREEKYSPKFPSYRLRFLREWFRAGCECNLSQLASLLSGIVKILIPISSKQPPRGPRYRRDTLAGVSAIQRPQVSSLVSDDTVSSPLTYRLAAHPDKVGSPVRSDTETHEPM